MASEKQKILLCGDVEGKFDALFKRVEAIMKKSGPFDLLLCVGNFFGVNNREFTPYKLGDKKAPIPTYILGPNKQDQIEFYPQDESEYELCENVYYLGKRGIYTDSKGVKIAYISGIYGKGGESWKYSEKDVSELCDLCFKGNAAFRGVDILLSSQWPSSIVEDPKKVNLTLNAFSDCASYLIMKLKPRYVVGGLEGVYYERPPFRCPNLGDHDTTMENATRFIGLARVGNANKDKWIYALNLCPLDKMKISELAQRTTDETACPFSFQELESKIFQNKRKSSAPEQYFYDMSNTDDSNPKQRGKKMRRPKVEFDQSKCWFCLASPSVEKHLIISVGNLSYLALAKGGIVDEHFLICPIEHFQSTLDQPDAVRQEISEFKKSLRKFYARSDKVAIFFERNYKTSHMQLQVVPIPPNAAREIKEIFLEEAEGHGFKMEELESHNRLDQILQAKIPYFTVELPDGTVLYAKIQQSMNFPLNFGREVLATGPVLNLGDKVDWKDCILNKEDEEKLVQKLRTDFEPFDFNLE